jgi:hypothetical protein
VPHEFILSPFEEPIAYIAFAVKWLSSLVCIAVSIYFYRRKTETWWLLIAFAFILPLLESVVGSLIHGLSLLPYGTAYPDQISPVPPGYTGSVTKFTAVTIHWDTVTPIMALGLGWAYLANRKKQAGEPPTAQT